MVCDIGGGSATFYIVDNQKKYIEKEKNYKIKGKDFVERTNPGWLEYLKTQGVIHFAKEGEHNKDYINAIGHVLSNRNESGDVSEKLKTFVDKSELKEHYKKMFLKEGLDEEFNLLAKYFAIEVATAVDEAKKKFNITKLIIKQTGDIRALMLGYRDPAVNPDAIPGEQKATDNSGKFLEKCIEHLKNLLGQSNNIDISWKFLTNGEEADLEMRRWLVELKEPISAEKIKYSTKNMAQNAEGLVMVNIGSSSTQIGVVKMEGNEPYLVHSDGINYCGAKGPSFQKLKESLKPVLVAAYDKGGRNFIFRNAIGYTFNEFTKEEITDLQKTPEEYIQAKDRKKKLVTANLVHLDKTSYNTLKDNEGLHKNLKIFLNGCASLMDKTGDITLHLMTKGHDEKMLFDPQWAYSVIQENDGIVDLGATVQHSTETTTTESQSNISPQAVQSAKAAATTINEIANRKVMGTEEINQIVNSLQQVITSLQNPTS